MKKRRKGGEERTEKVRRRNRMRMRIVMLMKVDWEKEKVCKNRHWKEERNSTLALLP